MVSDPGSVHGYRIRGRRWRGEGVCGGQTGKRANGQAGIRADGQTDRRAGMLSQASLKNSIENFIVPASAILASEPTGTAQGASGETTDHVTSCLRSAGIGALDEPNDATHPGKTEYPQLPGIPNAASVLAGPCRRRFWHVRFG